MYQLVSFSHLLAVALGQRPYTPPVPFAKRQNDCPTDGATKLKPLTNNFVISSRWGSFERRKNKWLKKIEFAQSNSVLLCFQRKNAMLTKNAFEYGLSKSEYLRKLILAESLAGKQWHMVETRQSSWNTMMQPDFQSWIVKYGAKQGLKPMA